MLRSSCTLPTLATIVEELVLNSLDSGATEIVVTTDTSDASSLCVQVRDNGHGIMSSDLRLVGNQGATSKAAQGERRMFGFRGEALHALAAICLLEIVTLCASSHDGAHSVVLHLGRRVSTGPAREARAIGTTVSARDIFVNRAVARKQFQHSQGAAPAEVRDTVSRLAVAHPDVAFRLCDSGRNTTVLRTYRTSSALNTHRQACARLPSHAIPHHLVRIPPHPNSPPFQIERATPPHSR